MARLAPARRTFYIILILDVIAFDFQSAQAIVHLHF